VDHELGDFSAWRTELQRARFPSITSAILMAASRMAARTRPSSATPVPRKPVSPLASFFAAAFCA
jgi:hypothetical protein